MNFEHTEDRRMLAQMLERFAAQRYGIDIRNDIAYSEQGYSPALWRELAELGVTGALFPPSHGGYGGEGFDIAVVFEAVGHALMVEPFLSVLLAGRAIAQSAADAGQAETHAHILEGMIAGTHLGAFAHHEPEGRYALHEVATSATPADGGWMLCGSKAVVSFGDRAHSIVVSARSAGAVDAAQGISLFLVPADSDGLDVRGYPCVDGGRAAELRLDAVRVSNDALLGRAGEAGAVIEKVVGLGVLALCAEALGAMEQVKAMTLDYLRTRKQFGVPIGSFQALQHRMADMLLEIEQARSAVINAAAALDGERVQRERALSAAKYTIGRVGTLVAEESVQMHGGIGVTWELALGHYAKRLTMIDHQLGDEDFHLQRYIGLARVPWTV